MPVYNHTANGSKL